MRILHLVFTVLLLFSLFIFFFIKLQGITIAKEILGLSKSNISFKVESTLDNWRNSINKSIFEKIDIDPYARNVSINRLSKSNKKCEYNSFVLHGWGRKAENNWSKNNLLDLGKYIDKDRKDECVYDFNWSEASYAPLPMIVNDAALWIEPVVSSFSKNTKFYEDNSICYGYSLGGIMCYKIGQNYNKSTNNKMKGVVMFDPAFDIDYDLDGNTKGKQNIDYKTSINTYYDNSLCFVGEYSIAGNKKLCELTDLTYLVGVNGVKTYVDDALYDFISHAFTYKLYENKEKADVQISLYDKDNVAVSDILSLENAGKSFKYLENQYYIKSLSTIALLLQTKAKKNNSKDSFSCGRENYTKEEYFSKCVVDIESLKFKIDNNKAKNDDFFKDNSCKKESDNVFILGTNKSDNFEASSNGCVIADMGKGDDKVFGNSYKPVKIYGREGNDVLSGATKKSDDKSVGYITYGVKELIGGKGNDKFVIENLDKTAKKDKTYTKVIDFGNNNDNDKLILKDSSKDKYKICGDKKDKNKVEICINKDLVAKIFGKKANKFYSSKKPFDSKKGGLVEYK